MKVDRKVPIPADGRQRYPWREMKVGDSFAFPSANRGAVSAAASWYASRHAKEFKFTIRKVDATTARCWRIA